MAAVLVLAACGSGSEAADDEGSGERTTSTTTAAGSTRSTSTTAAPDPRSSVTVTEEPGTIAIAIEDDDGKARSGVPVLFRGPIEASALSDETGVATVTVPGGGYDIVVETGCTDELKITRGTSGRAELPIGQRVDGKLTIGWQHRHLPALPTDWEALDGRGERTSIPNWRPGVNYRLSFTVVDRCSGNKPSPGASYEAWDYQTSANTTIVDRWGTRADSTGKGYVIAKCAGTGVITFTARDRENPREEAVDLIASSSRGPGRPNCRPD